MTVEQLNSRFGAPGRIVFRDGFAGRPNVVLAGRYGSAEIALFGANVLSYRPTGHSPVVFRPAKRDHGPEDGFHGGIPVCFPQFGNRLISGLPQHGLTRKAVFEVRGTEYSEEMTSVTLGFRSDEATRASWPHDFDFEYTVTVSMKLNLRAVVRNTGSGPFVFSCGFHPYFLVRDAQGVTVKGVGGLAYHDGYAKADGTTPEGDFAMGADADHILTLKPAAKHEFAVLDPGLSRAVAVVAGGIRRVVVWNPGAGHPLADLAPGEWRRFICVEPVSDWPGGETLEPGGSREFLAAIQATLENAPLT